MRTLQMIGPLALLLAGTLAAADEITLIDGKVIDDVRITAFTIHKVTYKEGRREASIPSWKVEKVTPGNPPKRYKEANDAVKEGDLETAAELYNTFAERTKPGTSNGWLRQFAYFRRAMIFVNEGTTNGYRDGVREIQELIKNIPDTKFLIDYYRLKLNYYLNLGDDKGKSNAGKLIGNWKKQINDNKYPNNYLYEVMLDEVMFKRDYLRSVKPAQVDGKIKEVLGLASRNADLALNRARVEMGWNQLLMSKWEGARPYLEKVTGAAMVDELSRARAWLGQGHTKFRKAGKTKEDVKGAILDYLRVYINFKKLADKDMRVRELVGWSLYFAELAMKEQGGSSSEQACKALRARRRTTYRDTEGGKK